MLSGSKKDLIQHCKENGHTVLEVTTKQLYIIQKGLTTDSVEELEKAWFEEFENRSHAFKDSCLVEFSNEVIKVEEL